MPGLLRPLACSVACAAFTLAIGAAAEDQAAPGATLDTIQIEARPTASPTTLETGGSSVVFQAEELRSVAGNQGDPLAAVATLPGVVQGGGGGVGAGFFVRGSDTGDNLFRVDGLPVGYIFHLGGATSVLNQDTVESFSTWLAGYPAEYGDRLGGVVDVRLREPRRDRLHQSYQIGFYESSALIEGPINDRDSGFLAFRRSYIDLLLPSSGSLGSGDTEYTTFPQFHDAQGRWRRELENGFLEFSLFTAKDEVGLLFQDDAAERDPAVRGALGADQSFTTLGTRWVQDLNRDWEQTVRLGRMEERFDFILGTQGPTDPEPGEPFYLDLITTTDFLTPQWRYFGYSLWTVGVDIEQRRTEIEAFAPAQPSEQSTGEPLAESTKYTVDETLRYREAAPYVEWEPPPLGALSPSLGLRYTHQELSGSSVTLGGWSPRSEWRYDLTFNTALIAQWGLYRQAPASNQRVPGAGNPELDWTEAEHRVLGVKHDLLGPWSLQVEGYHKPMRALVREQAEPPPDNYANAMRGEAYGLDILAKREVTDGRVGWIGYSYGRSFRDDGPDGKRRPFSSDQPHTVQVVWSQPFSEGGNWRWGARLNAHSGQTVTPIVGREEATYTDADGNDIDYWRPVYGENNSERLPYFVRLDLRAERSYRFGWGELTTIFELLNALQPLRPNVVGYSYDEDYANYDDPDEVSGFPFLPSFSVRATF